MKIKSIELLGAQHPLCFSMTASQNLTERFGSLGAMAEQLISDDIPTRVDAINDALTELMKAGRIYAKARGEELPPELPCRVADALPASFTSPVALILSVMQGDSKREVEVEDTGKNAEATLNR